MEGLGHVDGRGGVDRRSGAGRARSVLAGACAVGCLALTGAALAPSASAVARSGVTASTSDVAQATGPQTPPQDTGGSGPWPATAAVIATLAAAGGVWTYRVRSLSRPPARHRF